MVHIFRFGEISYKFKNLSDNKNYFHDKRTFVSYNLSNRLARPE